MRTFSFVVAAFAALMLATSAFAAAPKEITDGQKPLDPKLAPKQDGMSDGQKPLDKRLDKPQAEASDGQKPLDAKLTTPTTDSITPGQKPLSAGGGGATGMDASSGADVRWGDTSVHALTMAVGPVQVSLTGLVQVQLAMFTGSDSLLVNGSPAERVGVRMRQGRMGMTARFWDMLEVELGFQAAADTAQLLDANISLSFLPELALGAGLKKIPFSRFALISPGFQAMSDRPLGTQAMAPFQQLGLTLSGDIEKGMFMYTVGAYNGFERNVNFHQGYLLPATTLGNRFNNMALAGRISTEPLGYLGPNLADLRSGQDREKPLLGVGASFYYNNGATTEGFGVEGDVMLKVYGLHLLAEVIWDTSSPLVKPTTSSTIPAELDRFSFAAELGYTYAFDRDPFHLGVLFRAELLDDQMDLDDNGDSLVITGGLSFHWRRHNLKFNLEYMHRNELQGQSLDNDVILLQLSSQL